MDSLQSFGLSIANGLGPYVPRVIAALLILFVSWLVARGVRIVVNRVCQATSLDTRMHSAGLSRTLSDVAYWFVWLLALPALLGTLQLEGLLAPVNAMLSRLLGFLPSLIGAVIVFAIGLLAARIVREVITGVLTAMGSERFAARVGMASALGDNTLAGIVGSIGFVLILLPTVAAALQPLGLDSVTNPVSRLFDNIIGIIPRLVSATIIVVVAIVIGRVVAGVVTGMLAGMGINRVPEHLGLAPGFRIARRDASELGGSVAMIAILFVGIAQASEVLGFAILTDAVAALGRVLVHVAVALLVLGVGLWLASAIAGAIRSSGVANAGVVASVVRAALVFFTAALALLQAGLPAAIVTIAFGSVVGALAIGVAIAVGAGGRHVAKRLLERAADTMSRREQEPAGGAER